MTSNEKHKRDAEVYSFNILVEAKTRTLIVMTRKVHPDWGDDDIQRFFESVISHALKQEASK